MNEILEAVANPAVLVSVFLTIAVQFIFKHVPTAIKHVPTAIKSLLRGGKLRALRKIKSIRHNQDEVIFESMKAHAYYLVFMGTCALFLVLVTMGPLSVLLKFPMWVLWLVCSPVFFTEILWLNQLSYSKNIIMHRHKLRKMGSGL